MAVTQNSYIGNGSTTNYSFTFPYLKTVDVKCSIDATETTAFTLANATTIQFNSAPANGAKIKIFRKTDDADLTATFYAGSAIKSSDLNDNFTQNLYTTQEVNARYLSNLGGNMVGDLAMGEDADIIFEGATDNANETKLTVADPTADRTITFPDVSGNVVTTGDTGTVATGMIAADAITSAKIADDQINSEHYVDGSIDTAHIADSQVTTAKIANSNVTTDKIANDAVTSAKIADDQINSEHYVDGSIDTAHIADSQITSAKIVDGTIVAGDLASNSVTTAKITDANVTTAKIAADAITGAKIADDEINSEHYVAGSIDTEHIANSQVTTSKIADLNVTTGKIAADAITGAKIADDQINSEHYAAGSIDTEHIADSQITTAKIADDAVTTAKIADAELSTLAGMQSGTASKLADSTALTSDIADLNQIDGLTKQTTISDSDASFPTSGAVVDYVVAQIAPLGGLEVIATEVAFPNTQPQAGVVISISDAGGVVFNGSGTSTTGRTVGGSTVTINNAPSSLNSETLVAGVGLMVSSTGSSQTYNYHKILGKEDDIKQLSDDINDFNARYRVGSSNPTSALDAGDLFFNTSTQKLMVYNSTNSAWEEAQSIGNFFISTFSEAFDNSRTQFTLSNAPANVQQILLSLNGVVQKPGTAFTLSGSTVTLASAPASGTEYFAVVMGSTVNIGAPSDNTVSTAKIQSGAITGDKVSTNLDLIDNKKIRFGTSNDLQIYHDSNNSFIQDLGTGNLYIQSTSAGVYLQKVGGEDMAKFITDGAVELYFDNSKKLETTSIGIDVTGKVTTDELSVIKASGNLSAHFEAQSGLGTLEIGGSTGAFIDLKTPFSDDFDLRVDSNGTLTSVGNILLKVNGSESGVGILQNGAVELYFDNSKKLETTSDGVKTYGDHFFVGTGGNAVWDQSADNFFHGDNVKASFGNSNDLQIYHDGSNSIIDNSTGVFVVKGDDFRIKSNSTNEDMIRTYVNGAVELYYDNVKKFETNQFGAVVVDTSDETVQLRLDNNSGIAGYLFCLNSNTISLLDSQAHKHVQGIKDGAVELYYDNVKKFETASTGAQVHGSLNVSGDTIVGGELNLMQGTANANRFIDCSLADGQALFIRSTQGGDANHETMASFYRNGEVQLNYDNAHQLSTVSDGIQLQTNKKISRTPNGDGAILAVTNAAYAKSLFIGGWDHGTNSSGISRIRNSNDNLHLDSGSNGGEIFLNAYAAGDIRAKRTRPVSDNLYDLGSSSMRWDDIYATNTNIQTSDKTKKNTIVDSDLGLSFINKLKPVSYKFNDGTRTHYGLIAQDIETVLSDVSKPTTDFAGFIKTDLPDEYYKEAEPNIPEGKKEGDLKSAAHTEYGLRYGEFISPLIKAVQELTAKVETLETKVAALEAA